MKGTGNLLKKVALFLLLFCIMTSCENKRDINGDLDGMWQMTVWKDANNNTIKDKNGRIFYNIQLKLIPFRYFNDPGVNSSYVHAYFRHSPDSLIIFNPANYGSGECIPITDLMKYGVPADGKFHIDALDDRNMVLSSKEGTLYFRKY